MHGTDLRLEPNEASDLARVLDATIELGAAKGKRWAGRVRSGDRPINVEALEFRAASGPVFLPNCEPST